MKRFWKEAEAVAGPDGWQVLLDGRPVRTPARAPLLLPNIALAEAVKAEWQAAAETIDPRAMPLTGLANAAIDRVAPAREEFAASLASYAASDLLCYRADSPALLVAREAERWDPLLHWARQRYAVEFVVTSGIAPVDQPAATLARLRQAVAALEPFQLAGLSPLVTVGGSLITGLALSERAVDLETAWAAISLDEAWQLEQWGSDVEAEKSLASREADYRAGDRFLALLA